MIWVSSATRTVAPSRPKNPVETPTVFAAGSTLLTVPSICLSFGTSGGGAAEPGGGIGVLGAGGCCCACAIPAPSTATVTSNTTLATIPRRMGPSSFCATPGPRGDPGPRRPPSGGRLRRRHERVQSPCQSESQRRTALEHRRGSASPDDLTLRRHVGGGLDGPGGNVPAS